MLCTKVTLNVYSLENVVYHVLHKRIPLFTFRKLSEWFDDKTRLCRYASMQMSIVDGVYDIVL